MDLEYIKKLSDHVDKKYGDLSHVTKEEAISDQIGYNKYDTVLTNESLKEDIEQKGTIILTSEDLKELRRIDEAFAKAATLTKTIDFLCSKKLNLHTQIEQMEKDVKEYDDLIAYFSALKKDVQVTLV
jgi:hypothetical protein